MADSTDTAITSSQPHKEEDENHLLDLAQKLETHSSKDLRVAHLNVCSLRNKIEELRCLQLICRFEILAITETYPDKTVPDAVLDINGMKFVRLDRKRREEGGGRLCTEARDFFDRIGPTLGKAWLKSSNIILLGDFNCDLLNRGSPEIPVNTNAEKLCSVFDLFGMQNVVQEATRTTITSRTLIDLIQCHYKKRSY